MVLFASDLDNTLIFSCRYREKGDQCLEYLEGKPRGFCTRRFWKLLAAVEQRALFIPVTTRSIAQYRRICWSCPPRYAVTTNGGTLLVSGVPDPAWQAETAALVDPWRGEMADLARQLSAVPVPHRGKLVDDAYLFAACDRAEDASAIGALLGERTELVTAVSGRKVYFFPPALNKGTALERLRDRFSPDRTICAGDSVIDVPMLLSAGLAILPGGDLLPPGEGQKICPPGVRFPDFVLETVLEELNRAT